MEVDKYIESGILELYVAGLLSDEENFEVYQNAQKYPEIKKEILAIEEAVLQLTKSVAPPLVLRKGFDDIRTRVGIRKEPRVVQMPKQKETHWSTYLGWAAAVLLGAGVFWFYTQNQQLQADIKIVEQQNEVLEQQIFEARGSLSGTQKLLEDLRDKDVAVVSLGGREVSPESYAKAYWNKRENKVFIDAKGLPDPPSGMVYQVWSLKLDPLTPTSMGLLENFVKDENKVFVLNNPNETEAFGITLEPEGGSESPTLEQLYTLGAVSS